MRYTLGKVLVPVNILVPPTTGIPAAAKVVCPVPPLSIGVTPVTSAFARFTALADQDPPVTLTMPVHPLELALVPPLVIGMSDPAQTPVVILPPLAATPLSENAPDPFDV
jgi:hypothetical protein